MIHVLRPGLLTTVQDQGRTGHQRFGVSAGGAADPFAARVANALVGNAASAALLEMALAGPRLRFDADALIGFARRARQNTAGASATSASHRSRARPSPCASAETANFVR